jgi:hypothetical protein
MLAPKLPSSPTGYAWVVLFVVFLAFSAFLSTFLVSVRGYSLGSAGFVASLTSVTIGSCPCGRWLHADSGLPAGCRCRVVGQSPLTLPRETNRQPST